MCNVLAGDNFFFAESVQLVYIPYERLLTANITQKREHPYTLNK